jgi:hypothetical protein
MAWTSPDCVGGDYHAPRDARQTAARGGDLPMGHGFSYKQRWFRVLRACAPAGAGGGS